MISLLNSVKLSRRFKFTLNMETKKAASTCVVERSEATRRYKQITSKYHRHPVPFDLRRILELRRGITFYQGQGKRRRRRTRKRRARIQQKEQDRKEIDVLLDGMTRMEIE